MSDFDSPEGERAEILRLLGLHGRNTLSFLLRYDAPWRHFVTSEGAVGWLGAPGAAVGWSDPLCEQAQVPGVLRSFTSAMRSERRAICLIAVGEATALAALGLGYSVLKIGEDPWFDLGEWQMARGNRGKSLRRSLNLARRRGVEIETYRPAERRDLRTEAEIVDVLGRWRQAFPRSVPRSFMRPSPLEEVAEKQIFLARVAGRAETFLACSPVYGRSGYYLEDLIRAPEAVNGTSELLVVEALARLKASGARCAALGIAPLRGCATQPDPRARWLRPLLAFAIRRFERRYRLAALTHYEEKFRPTRWEGSFIAFHPALPRLRVVRAAVKFLEA